MYLLKPVPSTYSEKKRSDAEEGPERLVQLKVFGETASELIPHASDEPLFTCAAVTVPVPALSR